MDSIFDFRRSLAQRKKRSNGGFSGAKRCDAKHKLINKRRLQWILINFPETFQNIRRHFKNSTGINLSRSGLTTFTTQYFCVYDEYIIAFRDTIWFCVLLDCFFFFVCSWLWFICWLWTLRAHYLRNIIYRFLFGSRTARKAKLIC